MFGIGFPELILILVIGLIVLGPNKLPELAKALAKGLAEFKKATQEIKQNLDVDDNFREIKENLGGSIKELKDNIAESMSGIDNPLKDLKNDINDSISAINNPSPVEKPLDASNVLDIEPTPVEESVPAADSASATEPAAVSEQADIAEPPATEHAITASEVSAEPMLTEKKATDEGRG
jgi:sec-independent protein translocase protein TatA